MLTIFNFLLALKVKTSTMLEIGEDFLLKDLSQTLLCALCSGMAKYMIKTSSDIAQEILCEDSTKDEQKN